MASDMLLFHGWSDLDQFFGETAIPSTNAVPAITAFYDSNGKQPEGIAWESDF
jgi:hypothetical protein